MVTLQAAILGVVQGLTEFIPISSSAHLVIMPWMFRWDDPALQSLAFDVALHLGTLVALLVYFFKDWIRLARAGVLSIVERKIGEDVDRRMAWFLVIGSVPGAVAGLTLEKSIDRLFHSTPLKPEAMIAMAVIIALLGGLLLAAEKLARHARPIGRMTYRDAILIGLAQACAVFPGVSRSGSTITAGLAVGLERESAARFSFMLSAPIVAGAGALHVIKVVKAVSAGTVSGSEMILFPVGIITAAVFGVLCIRYLLIFLQKRSTIIFSVYRFILAAVIIAVALLRG